MGCRKLSYYQTAVISINNTIPKAYINYLFFDKNRQYKSGGFDQVSTAALNSFEELSLSFTPDEEGYVIIYVANQTNEDLNVYMDDLTIEHIEGPIIQTDDYYPFGLTFNSSERSGHLTNKILYNGKELQKDLGLDWYDYGARMYDPTLARFHTVDPLAGHFPGWSPYAAFNNNPINLVDPDGRAAVPPGKTYDDETGEMIHDDGIDDKKVYTGTKSDGSDRKLVGIEGNGPGQIKDHTQKFNDQLDRTGKFFSEKAQDFGNKYHSDAVTGIASVDKMLFFKKSVTDKGPFDIKVPGKGFSQGEVGEYSFYGGKLFRYDDYGNYNYGRAASAFGYGEKTALLGAGLNQTGKAIFNLDYAKKNWYPISNFSNLGDDLRDSYMIKQGFNHAR